MSMSVVAAARPGPLRQVLSPIRGQLIAAAVLAGFILWNIIHGAFVRPFVLTGVLRNYLQSGMDDIPTEESFALLDSRSSKFAKLHGQLA